MADIPRCEPSEEERAQDGWHWLNLTHNPSESWQWRVQINGWGRGGQTMSPIQAASYGYSYDSPSLTPDEVAALRAELSKSNRDAQTLAEAVLKLNRAYYELKIENQELTEQLADLGRGGEADGQPV